MAKAEINFGEASGGGFAWDLSSLVQVASSTENTPQTVTIDTSKRYLVVGTCKYSNKYYQEIHIIENGVDVAKIENNGTAQYFLTISISGTSMTVTPSDSRAVGIYQLG